MDGMAEDDRLTPRRKRSRSGEFVYRIVVRDLVLPFRIGILGHERHAPQKVRVNAELTVSPPAAFQHFAQVLDYETIIAGIRRLAERDHIFLVEALAEDIIELCFADARVIAARVGIEKVEAYPEAQGVGIVLERRRRGVRRRR
jgi:7,8-dihydroneopterin aldolase/epimerase/oxygenase